MGPKLRCCVITVHVLLARFGSKKLGILYSVCIDMSDQIRSTRAGHGDQAKIGHLHQPARAREAGRHAHCELRSQLLPALILPAKIQK
jgi:hypothetical protein